MADQYIEAFVQESDEQITELNNALLDFESDPSDAAAMDRIFRTAHTLKGNCGAMGFDAAEELAHALEDVLEAIRSGKLAPTPDLMDAVFDGVDELEAMLEDVAESGEVRRDAAGTVAALREHADVDGVAEPTDAEVDRLLEDVSAPADDAYSVYHARLAVSGDPAVHGRAVVDALDDAFDLLGTDPDGDVIDAGEYDGVLDAAFASVVEIAAVEAALEPVEAVREQVILDVTEEADAVASEAAAADASTADSGTDDTAVDDGASPEDLSVDELLQDEEVDQFDDLDEMAEEIEDTSEFEDLGDAGSFADLGLDESFDEEAAEDDEADDAADAADGDDAPADEDTAEDDQADDEVEDAAAEFAQLKEEVDPVGFDELQEELDDLEFDEYDSDDEVGFDELLDEDELAAEGAFASPSADALAPEDEASYDDAAVTEDAPATEDADDDGETADSGAAADETVDEPSVEADAADDGATGQTAEADLADDTEEPSVEAEADSTDDDAPADATADDLFGGETDDAAASTDDASDDAVAAADDGADDPATPADDAAGAASADDADVPASADDAEDEVFGEGGLDLSESSTADVGDEPVELGEDDLDLDLDDSFGDDADTAADVEAPDPGDDALGFDEDDIDFGEGTVPGADAPDDTEAESVGVGGALEDDSFSDPADGSDLDPDASTAEESEPVESFGDEDSVLDLDGTSVAGSADAETGSDEASFADVEEAAGGFEDLDAGDFGTDAADASLEDPGFSDASSTDDEDPDVDEERLEQIRSLGVPERGEGAGAHDTGSTSIRVDVQQLDEMLNMVEGLVTSRARLRRALIEDEPREVLAEELDDLEDVTSELQDTVMDVRLVPLRRAVNKLPRIVRDIARQQDKQVSFTMEGEDVELDRSILDEIGDPLIHLVRNAVDHGIESPAEREDAGKSEEGAIELTARRERDRVRIVVADDGSGIDPDDLRDAAVEEGIHTRSEVDSMADDEVYDLIFHSGFSTAEEVTDVSGRGVGMDVVADTVEGLDGTVTVDSEPGEGTTIEMELPVSLAIADVLFVEVGGEEYGIPIKVVDEIGPVLDVETQDGQEVLVSDGGEDRRELIRLADALGTPGTSDSNSGMVVHVRDDVREAAIHCDVVREQQEVVVKPFEGVLGDVPGLSGATVLGDGDVVNILDVETL